MEAEPHDPFESGLPGLARQLAVGGLVLDQLLAMEKWDDVKQALLTMSDEDIGLHARGGVATAQG